MSHPHFRRVLLKMSGEMLKGNADFGISPDAVLEAAAVVKTAVDTGVELALVVGGGNLFRGLGASRLGMDRNAADRIGMMATVMNALALRGGLEQTGVRAEVLSAMDIRGVAEAFDYRKANRLLDEGAVVIFAAGTGHPFFTTDTTAALRACEIGADAVLKGTKVDGVYSDDPVRNPAAVRF